jgi:adenosine deaminase
MSKKENKIDNSTKADNKENKPTEEKEQIIEGARNEIIREKKLSMLSKPNKIKAMVPDFSSSDEELKSLGLEKEDGKWFVSNRQYFPNSLSENSVIINYGRKEDGSADLGFCAQDEFDKIYADTNQYDQGQISYINSGSLKKGESVDATKCATGEFTLMPEGTKVKTNEGDVVVAPGQVLIVNENKNSVFASDISEILKRYVPDTMNPASKEAFALLKKFEEDKKSKKPEELSESFSELVSKFGSIERNTKMYKAYSTETNIETLRDDFKQAAEIVKELDKEISTNINSLDFKERIEQAKGVLKEIISNKDLSPEKEDIKISYVLARLLPKTNNHQHLKGSVPMETLLERAEKHNFNEEQIGAIKNAYNNGAEGFENLDQFNKAYGIIGSAIRTPEDYQAAVKGIIEEATRAGQLTTEIRCSVIGQRDSEGNTLDPHVATENILEAMKKTCENIGQEAPKVGLTFLGYRGRDWKPEEVIDHAKLAVEFAKKYPEKKFSFDIAGPEDTGYNPTHFKEGFDLIKAYNEDVKSGKIKGEQIGVTIHAGETPTYNDGGAGNKAIEEALDMGANRIGHGVQAVTNLDTLERLKKSGATVEICGVCNISSIPLNTKGMAIHPVQEFISKDIPITICTDNDAICGTNITKEYAEFLLTGHNGLMNWNNVKDVARNGIESSFISDKDKKEALKTFDERIRIIERLVNDTKDSLEIDRIRDEIKNIKEVA